MICEMMEGFDTLIAIVNQPDNPVEAQQIMTAVRSNDNIKLDIISGRTK